MKKIGVSLIVAITLFLLLVGSLDARDVVASSKCGGSHNYLGASCCSSSVDSVAKHFTKNKRLYPYQGWVKVGVTVSSWSSSRTTDPLCESGVGTSRGTLSVNKTVLALRAVYRVVTDTVSAGFSKSCVDDTCSSTGNVVVNKPINSTATLKWYISASGRYEVLARATSSGYSHIQVDIYMNYHGGASANIGWWSSWCSGDDDGSDTTYTGSISVWSNLGKYKGLVNVSKDGSFETDVIPYSDSWTTTNSNARHTYGLEASREALVPTLNPVWSLTKWFSRYNQRATVRVQKDGDYLFWTEKKASIYVFRNYRRIFSATVPDEHYIQLRGLKAGDEIWIYPKVLGTNTFKLYMATKTPLLYWNVSGSLNQNNVVDVVVKAGGSVDAEAVYRLGSASLVLKTNVDVPAKALASLNSWDAQEVVVSSFAPYSYVDRGIVYDIVFPEHVYDSTGEPTYNHTEGWSVSTWLFAENVRLDGLFGKYNVSLRLSSAVPQPSVTVRLVLNPGGIRLYEGTLENGWTGFNVTVPGVELYGDYDYLYIYLSTGSGLKKINANVSLSFLASKLNLTRIEVYVDGRLERVVYDSSVEGVVQVGSNATIIAIYSVERNEIYMGPALPGEFVDITIVPGTYRLGGDFYMFVVGENMGFYPVVNETLMVEREYNCSRRKPVRIVPERLPRVEGDVSGRVFAFVAPERLGQARLCLNDACYVWNVTRALVNIERIVYNETHATVYLSSRYECCNEPVDKRIVYVAIINGRIVACTNTTLLAIPYSRLQDYRDLDRLTVRPYWLGDDKPIEPIRFSGGASVDAVFATVKVERFDSVLETTGPYGFFAGLDGRPTRLNITGSLLVNISGMLLWARWTGSSFTATLPADIGLGEVELIWVPPETRDVLLVPWIQRW